jgi:TetR/AcrR family transcriptional repressor of nem operon
MARPRKSNHASAVEAAKSAFLRKGYAGTSTRQIEECSGVTRFTLQTTYGGKLLFFLEVLDAYLDRAEVCYFPDPVTTDLEGLALWFERLSAADAMPKIGDKGCMLLSSIDEFKRGGSDIDERIDRYFAAIQDRFSLIIANAVDRKEIAADANPKDKAALLVSLLLGISIAVRARTHDDAVLPYTSAAATMIRSWRV